MEYSVCLNKCLPGSVIQIAHDITGTVMKTEINTRAKLTVNIDGTCVEIFNVRRGWDLASQSIRDCIVRGNTIYRFYGTAMRIEGNDTYLDYKVFVEQMRSHKVSVAFNGK